MTLKKKKQVDFHGFLLNFIAKFLKPYKDVFFFHSKNCEWFACGFKYNNK